MTPDKYVEFLLAIIAILMTIVGFFLKSLSKKIDTWGEEQRETNKQLALINQNLNFLEARNDKQSEEISDIRKWITNIVDRVSLLSTTFEMVRFASCKDDCPVAKAIKDAQDVIRRK